MFHTNRLKPYNSFFFFFQQKEQNVFYYLLKILPSCPWHSCKVYEKSTVVNFINESLFESDLFSVFFFFLNGTH